MTIKVRCKCGKEYSLATEKRGKRLRCSSCGERFVVGEQPTVPQELPRKKEKNQQKKTTAKGPRPEVAPHSPPPEPDQEPPSDNHTSDVGLPPTPKLSLHESVDELDLLDEHLAKVWPEWNDVPVHMVNMGDQAKAFTVIPYVWGFLWDLVDPAWKAAGLSPPAGPTYFSGLRNNTAAIVVAIVIAGGAVTCAFLSKNLPDGSPDGAFVLLFFTPVFGVLFGVPMAYGLRISVTENLRRGIRGTKIEIDSETVRRGGYGYGPTVRTTAREVGLDRRQRLRAMKMAWFYCQLQWWLMHCTICAVCSSLLAIPLRAAKL